MLGKNFSRRHFEIFSYFLPENRLFNISCKLEDILHEMSKTIVWENKKNIINLSSVELAHRVVKIK